MTTLNAARSLVRSVPFDARHYTCGAHAGYRAMPATRFGIKLFKSYVVRDENYNLQDMAHSFGLAPRVFGRFTELDSYGKMYYGFVTESIQETEQQRFYNPGKVDLCVVSDYLLWRKTNRDIVNDLKLQMENIGMTSKDVDNWANVGFHNGRLVCIDFSSESFSPEFN